MDTARQLLRLEEELVGLRQHRRYLLERLAGLDENMSMKEQLIAALRRETAHEEVPGSPAPELRYGAVRSAILERLAEEPDGMTGVAIGHMLRRRFGDSINPKSHHAALRRLGQEGLAIRHGRIWKAAADLS